MTETSAPDYETERELKQAIEIHRLRQRLDLVAKFALIAERDLVILSTSAGATVPETDRKS